MQYNIETYGGCEGDPELLGIWFTWPSKVASYMKKAGKGMTWGKNINTSLVKTLQKQYKVLINQGSPPPTYLSKVGYVVTWNPGAIDLANKIKTIVGSPIEKILNFFQALSHLSSIGKIPFDIYDPKTSKQTKLALKKEKGKSVLDKTIGSLKNAATIVHVGALGLAGFGIYLFINKRRK